MPSCKRPWRSSPAKAWRAPAWTLSPRRPASIRLCSITTFRTRTRSTAESSTRSLPSCLLALLGVRPARHRGRALPEYAATHFDAIAESPYHAHIFMGEMMTAAAAGPRTWIACSRCTCGPLATGFSSCWKLVSKSGEFRSVIRRTSCRRHRLHRALFFDRAAAQQVHERESLGHALDSRAPGCGARLHSRRVVRRSRCRVSSSPRSIAAQDKSPSTFRPHSYRRASG